MSPGCCSDFKSDNKKLTLAAQISGPAETAFPDGPPKPATSDKDKDKDKNGTTEPAKTDAAKPDGQDSSAAPPQIKTATQPINVIVVADTDILDDRFWVQVQDFFGQRVAIPSRQQWRFRHQRGRRAVRRQRSHRPAQRAAPRRGPSAWCRTSSASPTSATRRARRTSSNKLKDTEAKIKDLRGKSGGAGGTATLAAEQVQTHRQFPRADAGDPAASCATCSSICARTSIG